MKRIITVGGLQFSGKSTFCDNLQKQSNGQYRHIDADVISSRLATNGESFFRYCHYLNPQFTDQILKSFEKQGIYDKQRQLLNYGAWVIRDEGVRLWERILGEITAISIAEQLQRTSASPIIEVLGINKAARQGLYERMYAWTKHKFGGEQVAEQIKDMPKTIVFFDQGLDTSLGRFALGRKKPNSILKCSRELIEKTYQEQEVPTDGEVPNTENIIITNVNQVQPVLERLLALPN